MKNSQKGFVVPLLITITVLSLLGIGGWTYVTNQKIESQNKANPFQESSTSTEKDNDISKINKEEEIAVTQKTSTSTTFIVSTSTSSSTLNSKIISEAKNCASDIKCFVEALKNCTPTKFNRVMSSQVLGSDITTGIDFELISKNVGCEIRVKLNKYNIKASSELLKDWNGADNKAETDMVKIYQDAQVLGITAIGKTGVCSVSKNLIDFFSKKESDFMYGDGWILVGGSNSGCSGELFNLFKI
jgi:hypothetical protein